MNSILSSENNILRRSAVSEKNVFIILKQENVLCCFYYMDKLSKLKYKHNFNFNFISVQTKQYSLQESA